MTAETQGRAVPVRLKIQRKTVQGMAVDPGRDAFMWDAELRGFGVRAKPSGVKSYLVQYRNRNGATRRYTIGRCNELTPDQARREAMALLGRIALGEDPSRERKEARKVGSVNELLDRYFEALEAGRIYKRNGETMKESSIRQTKGMVSRHVRPLIGKRSLTEVTPAVIRRMVSDIVAGKTAVRVKVGRHGFARVTGGPMSAAKTTSMLSSAFTWGIRNGFAESNPCLGVELPKGKAGDRFLTPDEYRRLGDALKSAHHVSEAARVAIWALALTGARRNEIASLRPGDLDRASRGLRLADTKTGKQLRPCGAVAFEVLERAPSNGEWLFPASRGAGYLYLNAYFSQITQIAGLDDVTPHTLRHSFATVAAELEYSEMTVGGLLGHSKHGRGITSRYIHRVDSVLTAAADHVSRTVLDRMLGTSAADGAFAFMGDQAPPPDPE